MFVILSHWIVNIDNIDCVTIYTDKDDISKQWLEVMFTSKWCILVDDGQDMRILRDAISRATKRSKN